jgi:hypothetical protein
VPGERIGAPVLDASATAARPLPDAHVPATGRVAVRLRVAAGAVVTRRHEDLVASGAA